MPSDSADGNVRPRWRGYAQLLLIAVLVVVALRLARAPARVEVEVGSGATVESATPTVSTFDPVATEESMTVDLTGTVSLADRVSVMAEVGGRVTWVSPEFTNGGRLAPDEPFVRIDTAKYSLEVQAAQNAVAEAEARLSTQPGPVSEAALESARTALRLAELALSRTEISLPYEARVISADVSVGELVGPPELVGAQAMLGIVYSTEALEVNAPIEVADLAYLAPAVGRSARVSTQSGVHAARIVRVSSVLAPRTRLSTIFLRFSPAHRASSLPLPNTFAEVEIEGPPYRNVYLLPESVLQQDDAVWVVENGALRRVVPNAIAWTSEGLIVEAFDAADGIVIGALPGAREGLAVELAGAAS